jgi:hypothetical protein
MTEENEQPSVIDTRMALFHKIGLLVSGQTSEDVVQALADHLGQAIAFCCDEIEEADVALEALVPEIKQSMRVNWDHSRHAQEAARMMAEAVLKDGRHDA